MMKKLLLVILLGVFITGICFAQISQDKQDNIICDDSTGTDDIDPQEIKQILNNLGGNIFPSPSDSIYPPFNWEPYEDVPEPIDPIMPEPQIDSYGFSFRGGIVYLGVYVYKDGTIADIKVLESVLAGLDEAAVNAVKKCKFKPGKDKEGKAIDTAYIQPVEFVIRQYKKDASVVEAERNSLIRYFNEFNERLNREFDSWHPRKLVMNTPPVELLKTDTKEVTIAGKVWVNPETIDSVFEYLPYEFPPIPVKTSEAVYPVRFRNDNFPQGLVYLAVEVFRKGEIRKIWVVRSLMPGPEGLDDEAIKLVRQWKFKPGSVKGKAIDTIVIVPIEYLYYR